MSIYVAQIVNILGSRRKKQTEAESSQNLTLSRRRGFEIPPRCRLRANFPLINEKINNLMVITFKVLNFPDIQAALCST